MPNYLCVQRRVPTKQAAPSPTDMQQMYAKFAAWQAQFKDQLVDLGGPVGDGKLVTAEEPADGPMVEVKELIGGYMIVSADSLDQAIAVAEQCPGLVRPGSGVEVMEIRRP